MGESADGLSKKTIKEEKCSRDYIVDFDDDKNVSMKDLLASCLMQSVLNILEIEHDKITIYREPEVTYEIRKLLYPIEFPNGEPGSWDVSFDPSLKKVEVCIDDCKMKIPWETISYWFRVVYEMESKYGKQEG